MSETPKRHGLMAEIWHAEDSATQGIRSVYTADNVLVCSLAVGSPREALIENAPELAVLCSQLLNRRRLDLLGKGLDPERDDLCVRGGMTVAAALAGWDVPPEPEG